MAQIESSTTGVVDRSADNAAAADNSRADPSVAAAGNSGKTARDMRSKSIVLLVFNGILISWILLSPAQGPARRWPVAAANLLAPLIALLWSLPLALRLWRGRWRDGWSGIWHGGPEAAFGDAARRGSAGAFTLAFVAFGFAQFAWYYYELLRQQPPFPSWADAGYLLAYPCLVAGVLLLPTRRLTGLQRGRVLMDSVMTLAAAATFSWYFVLGPTILAGSETTLQRALSAVYPIADLLVLFCLLLTVARVRGVEPVRGVLPLCLGLLVVIVTDVVFGYQTIHGAYVPGSTLDAGWPLGYMLLALGARGVLVSAPQPAPSRPSSTSRSASRASAGRQDALASGIETMLPYALVPMVGALVLGTLQERSTALVAGVYVGSAAIVLLVVLRQVLAIRQNARLYAELSRAYAQLEQSHHSLESANLTLAQTEERFRAAAESASDLIYEVDFGTGGLEWFGDVGRYAGGNGGALPATVKDWEQIIHPEDRNRVLQTFRRHVESGERYEMEYRVTSGDGKHRYWLDSGRVTYRDGGVPRRAVGAVSDVTERKRAEALEGERAGLRQAVSAMEGVLGVVGHELRTPLAGLRAMSEFLLTDGAIGTSDCEQMLSGINEEVVRMSETVNDLLEAARLNSGLAKWKWSTFELRPICEEAIDPIRPLLDESAVQLGCEVEDGLILRGDCDAVRRLVLNLLSNARKYTKRGSIHVTARQTEEAGARWIEVLVSDTGAGIPPEIRDRLGEAFALNAGMVGANHVNGTGLGLAICKGIAAAHGGRLSIRSQVGQGTTVVAKLRADLEGPVTLQGKSAVDSGASALVA